LADMGVSAATAATKSTSRTNGKQAGLGRAVEWRFARPARAFNQFLSAFSISFGALADFRLEKIL